MIRLLADENFNNNIVRGSVCETPVSIGSASKVLASRERMIRRCWSGRPDIGGFF